MYRAYFVTVCRVALRPVASPFVPLVKKSDWLIPSLTANADGANARNPKTRITGNILIRSFFIICFLCWWTPVFGFVLCFYFRTLSVSMQPSFSLF